MTPEVERLLADLRHHDICAVAHAGLEAADLIERLTSELESLHDNQKRALKRADA